VNSGPELALAASTRDWADRLHRFLLDHGGGRVTSRIMGADQAASDHYEVLVIDDICSFLTPRLVRSIRQSGREMIGVYNPADAPDAKRHLLECGITDVIESDAAPEEFLSVAAGTLAHRQPTQDPVVRTSKSFRIGVLGPLGGVGVTEVAIGLARALSHTLSTVLIDLDQTTPSIAQRLDLPLHPNLLSAVDISHHGGRLDEAMIESDGLRIIGGLAAPGSMEVAPVEVEGLLEEVGASGPAVVVADLGVLSPDRLGLPTFNGLIVVGSSNPVGLSRLVRLVQAVTIIAGGADVVAVGNRTAGGRREFETRAELTRLLPGVPVAILPEDRGMERAAWEGVTLTRGMFARSMERMATLIEGVMR
jgi:MinD-like ATPase involved in chromosome partitioning or flagellar assembly